MPRIPPGRNAEGKSDLRPPPKGDAVLNEASLRVTALEVLRYEADDDRLARPLGVMGVETFGAMLGDRIEVRATLSRPAYTYLIVFRPDGTEKVLFPRDATDVPEETSELHYPSKQGGSRYTLAEGAGLWIVALVSSSNRLPTYREWRAQHPGLTWPKPQGTAGTVWRDYGEGLEVLADKTERVRVSKPAAADVPIIRVTDWLRAESQGVVAAVGFTVGKR